MTIGWLLSIHRDYHISAADAVLETCSLPFGEPYWTSGAGLTDRTYTGQRDDGAGLMDYNARMYSPRLGRFISADTIVPGMMPVHWDRYAYVGNSPLRFTDPSGHYGVCDDQKCAGTPLKVTIVPKNILGRRLTNEEKRVLAVLIMGETSTWTDTGYFKWLIWGLLNKISYDSTKTWQDKTIYESWQNEESGLIRGAFRRMAVEDYGITLSTDPTPEEYWAMLVSLSDNYESTNRDSRVSDKHGGDLKSEFQEVLKAVNTIEFLWYLHGPRSAADPTHGGVGHVKISGAADLVEANKAAIKCKPKEGYGYASSSPVYKQADGDSAFILMNNPSPYW